MMIIAGVFPLFQGIFPNTYGLLNVFVDRYRQKLQGSYQRVFFLEA